MKQQYRTPPMPQQNMQLLAYMAGLIDFQKEIDAIREKFLREIEDLRQMYVNELGKPSDEMLAVVQDAQDRIDTLDTMLLHLHEVAKKIQITQKGDRGEKGDTGKDGKDGYTPVVGYDFFTEPEKQAFIKRIMDSIVLPKDGKPGKDGRDGKDAVINKISVEDIQGLREYLDSIRRASALNGGVRGGGDTVVAGVGISIARDTNGKTVITNTATHPTIYTETPSGLINGVNVTYTTANTIATIYSFGINGQFIHPSEYSVAGSTITFSTPFHSSLSGLPFTIIYSS